MLAVPIVPDLDGPERRTPADSDGTPPVRFVHVERDGRVVADLFELEVPVQRALPVVLAELRGMRAAGSEELGRALVAAGATPAPRARVLARPPRAPQRVDGVRTHAARPARRGAAAACLAAHPPDHVDTPVIRGEDSGRHLAGILAGKLGPRGLPRRRAAFGGPWVMEVFREPGARGAGKALLQRALVLSEGSLGLAVTHGNPAERVYASLGFKRIFTAYSVDL